MGKCRRLTLTLATLLFLVPTVSFALGLGPITMRSALNQPLLAEIDVHSVQPGDLKGLSVKLASDEDFARIRVEPHPFLYQLKFKVAYRKKGGAYIRITSTQPVTEPYLDFLIEAKWPRGRALKEYTVLVDPPVLAEDKAPPVSQAAVREPVETFTPAPVQSEPRQTRPSPASTRAETQTERPKRVRPKPEPVKPKPEPAIDDDVKPTAPKNIFKPAPQPEVTAAAPGSLNYGVVKRKDTLWQIAEDLKESSGSGASVHQLMMALLKSNPDAFIDGNINLVKAGFVLRIDDPAMLEEISQAEAVRTFRKQMTAWRARSKGRLVKQVAGAGSGSTGSQVAPIQRQPKDKPASAAKTAKEQAKLQLVQPGKDSQGSGSGKDDAKVKQLRQDLLLATEQLDATTAEGGELDKQSKELKEQLDNIQRLIMLKDEELQALQGQLAQKQAEQPAEAVKKPEAGKPPVAATAQAQTEDEYAFDLSALGLSSDMLLVGGVVILLLLVWLYMRRRKMHDGFEESILNVGGNEFDASGFPASGLSSGQAESALVSDFSMSDMGGIQSDSADVDPISEADVYLAYGRHQQAEDILKQALETNPERQDLHSKLLEVYHAASNKDGFAAHAEQFHQLIGGDESNEYWSRIVGYGAEICPEHPLFGGTMMPSDGLDMDMGMDMDMGLGADDTVGVTTDENDLLDFEFNEDMLDDLGGGGATAAAAPAEDNSLDFDVDALDFGLEDSSPAPTSAPAVEAKSSEDDYSLDFDMGDSGSGYNEAVEELNEPTELNLSMDDFSSDAQGDSGLSLAMDMEESDLLEDTESDTIHGEPLSDDLDMSLDLSDTSDLGLDSDDLSDFEDAFSSDEDLGDDIFGDVDEIGTKLDLAKAYVDMGDSDGARSILDEVLEEGDDSQKQQAEQLLQQMG
ncbi:MAG: hypothetical protein OEZ68_08835 [Gammaproteobacteria bacterium]|nr:hypothetical protein [Gammaproteobacteria bacterium]MDH5800892.1 hypothetical protein [Gammaproteobacteria bacterium]